jgi:hypothetical protein
MTIEQMMREKLKGLPITRENALEAAVASVREQIYLNYCYAKPDVVEALLLVFRNSMNLLFAELDSEDDLSDQDTQRILQGIMNCSLAIDQTINELYSV